MKTRGKRGTVFSLRQIQCFVTTVERGSVTAAANALGVSPQAVSKSVNDLERSLGRSLFVRRASGLKPTPYGTSLYKKARCTLQEVRDLEEFAEGKGVEARRHIQLMLCIPKTANFSSLSQRIANFIYARTQIPANVGYGNYDECIEALDLGQADAFITVGKTNLEEFEVNTIDNVEVGALMIKNHRLAQKKLLSVDDVGNIPVYISPNFPFFNQSYLEMVKAKGYGNVLEPRTMALSIFGIYNALAIEGGVVVMPSIQGVDDWMPNCVSVPFDPQKVPRMPLCLVTPRQEKGAYTRALEELLLPSHGTSFSVSEATQPKVTP